MTTTNRMKTATGASRRTIASYSIYAEAERAVDWLADHGFAVERSAIVGTGLRSVEQVTGRMTPGRAATIGAAQGALIGAHSPCCSAPSSRGPSSSSCCCTRWR